MIYLIRTTDGAVVRMRDGVKLSDPVRDVATSRYTAFGCLPGGVTLETQTGLEVRLAVDEEEADKLHAHLATHAAACVVDGDDYHKAVRAKIDRIMGREPEAEAEPEADAPPPPSPADDLAPDDGSPPIAAAMLDTATADEPASESPDGEKPKPRRRSRRSSK